MPMTRDPHPSHDPYLIAQFAAGDLSGPSLATAASLVADCPRCGELFTDLAAIASATAGLAAPERPRDFRLTLVDAARLRSPWRLWLGGLAQPRFAFTQPLGAALATLGLAGLLLGVLPNLNVSTGSSASAPAPVAEGTAPAAPSNGKTAAGAGEPAAASGDSASSIACAMKCPASAGFFSTYLTLSVPLELGGV